MNLRRSASPRRPPPPGGPAHGFRHRGPRPDAHHEWQWAARAVGTLHRDVLRGFCGSRPVEDCGRVPRPQRRRQPRIAVRLRPARPLPRLTVGVRLKWTAAPSRRCPMQRRQIMYARQPSSIDAGIAHAPPHVMPALEGVDGYGCSTGRPAMYSPASPRRRAVWSPSAVSRPCRGDFRWQRRRCLAPRPPVARRAAGQARIDRGIDF